MKNSKRQSPRRQRRTMRAAVVISLGLSVLVLSPLLVSAHPMGMALHTQRAFAHNRPGHEPKAMLPEPCAPCGEAFNPLRSVLNLPGIKKVNRLKALKIQDYTQKKGLDALKSI